MSDAEDLVRLHLLCYPESAFAQAMRAREDCNVVQVLQWDPSCVDTNVVLNTRPNCPHSCVLQIMAHASYMYSWVPVGSEYPRLQCHQGCMSIMVYCIMFYLCRTSVHTWASVSYFSSAQLAQNKLQLQIQISVADRTFILILHGDQYSTQLNI